MGRRKGYGGWFISAEERIRRSIGAGIGQQEVGHWLGAVGALKDRVDKGKRM